jgi:glutaryl-CoA dehydrogenase
MYRQVFQGCARKALAGRTALGAVRFASSSTATGFNWQDPLSSNTLLTEEELAISETAERYCQERLLPRVLRKGSCPSPSTMELKLTVNTRGV